MPLRNLSNDYLIDRVQKNTTPSPGSRREREDAAIQDSMGPVQTAREHLARPTWASSSPASS
jgi:hypothetical protein